MKYTVVKWLGSIIIISISIVVAVKTTFKGKISKETLYVYNLPQNSFTLKDDKKAKISISLGVKSEKAANELSEKQDIIIKVLKEVFLQQDSTFFTDVLNKQIVKNKIIEELVKKDVFVDFVKFVSVPKIF